MSTMSTVIAALKGRLGNTEYFVCAMKANYLAKKVTFGPEEQGWEDMTLEELYQRDIHYDRVKKQIAPYLAHNPDRFFGAVIISIKNLNPESFEPIAKVAGKMLNVYDSQAGSMGFLTLSEGEELRPLDGQHRLKAIKFAIEGVDERGDEIGGLTPDSDLADEEVTVILIPHDEKDKKKTRRIFTKVNRYAKPTTTGQNLVTDDDDIIAVLSRDITNNIIGARLVNYKSNTLSNNAVYFTTLATVADCNEAILSHSFAGTGAINRQSLPDQGRQDLYRKKVTEVWKHLVTHAPHFPDMLRKGEDGNKKRKELRANYLLGKPVPQVCLFSVFSRLTNLPKDHPPLSYKEATDMLHKVNWHKNDKLWDRLLMSGDRILTKNKNIAVGVLCYMLGEKLNAKQEAELLSKYKALFPESEQASVSLPDKIARG